MNKKYYIKDIMSQIRDFKEFNISSHDIEIAEENIFNFKYLIKPSERFILNSVLQKLSSEEKVIVSMFLTDLYNAGGEEYAISCFLNIYNNSLKDLSRDISFIKKHASKIGAECIISEITNENVGTDNVNTSINIDLCIVDIFYRTGMYDNILEAIAEEMDENKD